MLNRKFMAPAAALLAAAIALPALGQSTTAPKPNLTPPAKPSVAPPQKADPNNPTRPDSKPKAPTRRGPVQVGQDAPDWTAADPTGKQHKLSDYKGKLVLMDFWGTWCPPCRAAMPGLQKMHEEYGSKGLVVLGMNFEQKPDADPAGFMKKNKITYGLMLNAMPIAQQYGVQSWPTFILVAPDGKVVHRDQGYSEAVERKLENAIKAHINKASPGAAKPGKKDKKETEKKQPDKKEGDKPAETKPGPG